MFQKSFVRFKNGYVVTFDTLIVENVYQSPIQLPPRKKPPPQPPPKGERAFDLIPATEPESHPYYPQQIPDQVRDEVFLSTTPTPRGSHTPRGLTPPPILCRPDGL